jgi:hypothetical protein
VTEFEPNPFRAGGFAGAVFTVLFVLAVMGFAILTYFVVQVLT